MYPELHRGVPGHEEALARIERATFPDPWPEKVFEECLQPWSGIRTWVAVNRGRVIGYACAALPAPGVLHIANLCVVRSCRRMGVGGLLLSTAEDWGTSMGSAMCFLEVRATNRAALSLYSARGYLPFEHLAGYYGERSHGLRLFRRLKQDGRGRDGLVRALNRRLGCVPAVGVVLGSGLSWIAGIKGEGESIPWGELPGLGGEDLPGHPGRIVTSSCGRFLFILGRRHHYQGFDGDETALLPTALSDMGISTWILTSSAGAVSRRLSTGDAMVFRDHLNLSGCVPSVRTRAADPVYSARLRSIAAERARLTGARVSEGLFACVSGPAYETAAELELLSRMGVGAVSMSTAPEALALSARGCDVLGLAFITNECGPGHEVTHREVLEAQENLRSGLEPFMSGLLEDVGRHAVR